jgi:Family of unknown function (DUF6348)
MNTAAHAIDLLIAAAAEYAPRKTGEASAGFETLGLFIDVNALQAMDGGFMSLFIGEVNASRRPGETGINITCVGMGNDMPSAVAEAVGHWALGTLPVLAEWRGGHSCLASEEPFEAKGGRFDLLAGPTVMRGGPDADAEPAQPPQRFADLLSPLLRERHLARRVHWLEMFASKSDDGSVDATFRWNNRDWTPGRKALEGIAGAWPPSDEPMRTCRQFAMLLPKEGNRDELLQPTFWQRLRGRA